MLYRRRSRLGESIRIADNAKTHRYGVCNAMETLLVHANVAAKVLPELGKIYLDKNVELRGDEAARKLVAQMTAATEADWQTEYLAPILSVRVVANLDEAIEHINQYSSQHTDSIVTEIIQARCASCARSIHPADGKCVDALCGWLRVWAGGGDRHFHG